MSGNTSQNPATWNITGNIVPIEISEPTVTGQFSKHDVKLEIEDAVVIDSLQLIPVKSTYDGDD